MNGSSGRPPLFHTKEFWAGLLYFGIGLATVLLGQNYRFGSPAQMGPGFFPSVLGGLLALVGALCVLRVIRRGGSEVGRIAWRPLITIVGATIAFALLLPTAGLPIALIVLALIGATASQHFRLEIKAGLGLLAFVGLCTLVFVRGLNVPLPILGSWFGG